MWIPIGPSSAGGLRNQARLCLVDAWGVLDSIIKAASHLSLLLVSQTTTFFYSRQPPVSSLSLFSGFAPCQVETVTATARKVECAIDGWQGTAKCVSSSAIFLCCCKPRLLTDCLSYRIIDIAYVPLIAVHIHDSSVTSWLNNSISLFLPVACVRIDCLWYQSHWRITTYHCWTYWPARNLKDRISESGTVEKKPFLSRVCLEYPSSHFWFKK